MPYIQLKSIKLHNPHRSRKNLHLVASGGSGPLCTADLCVLEGPGIAAGRLPAHPARSEPTSPGLSKIKVDVFECLVIARHLFSSLFIREVRKKIGVKVNGWRVCCRENCDRGGLSLDTAEPETR